MCYINFDIIAKTVMYVNIQFLFRQSNGRQIATKKYQH